MNELLKHPADSGLQPGSDEGADADDKTSQGGEPDSAAELAALKEANEKYQKQVADGQEAVARMQSERDKANSDLQKQTQASVDKLMEIQKANALAADPGMTREEWAAKMEKDGAGATLDFIEGVMGETASKEDVAAVMAENKKLAEAVEAMKSMTTTELQNLRMEPRLEKYREEVDELRKDDSLAGLPQEALIAVAERVAAAKGPEKPERDQIPGSSGSDRVATSDQSEVDPAKLKAYEERVGFKLEADELAHLKSTGVLA